MGIASKDEPVGLVVKDRVGAAGVRGNTLSIKELQSAETAIIQYVQHQTFHETFTVLRNLEQYDAKLSGKKHGSKVQGSEHLEG